MSAGKRQPQLHDAGPGFWTINAIAPMSRMEFDVGAAARLPARQGRCVGPVTRQGRGTAKVTCRQLEIPVLQGVGSGRSSHVPEATRSCRSTSELHAVPTVLASRSVMERRMPSAFCTGASARPIVSDALRGASATRVTASREQQVRSISCSPFLP